MAVGDVSRWMWIEAPNKTPVFQAISGDRRWKEMAHILLNKFHVCFSSTKHRIIHVQSLSTWNPRNLFTNMRSLFLNFWVLYPLNKSFWRNAIFSSSRPTWWWPHDLVPFLRLAQEAAPGLRPLALFGSERPRKLAASGANMTCPSGPGSPACSDDHSDLDFSLEINEVTLAGLDDVACWFAATSNLKATSRSYTVPPHLKMGFS